MNNGSFIYSFTYYVFIECLLGSGNVIGISNTKIKFWSSGQAFQIMLGKDGVPGEHKGGMPRL